MYGDFFLVETNRKGKQNSNSVNAEAERRNQRREKEQMKKDKGVAVAVASPKDSDEVDDKPEDPTLRPFRFAARNASSKYDFVKVSLSF